MAASRQKMEFELKKESYEAIAPGSACKIGSEFPGMEKLLQTLPMAACRYQKNGCQIVQDPKNISHHEEDCPVRDVECIFLYCKRMVPASKSAMAKHLQDQHKARFEPLDLGYYLKDTAFNGQKMKIEPEARIMWRYIDEGTYKRWFDGPVQFNEKLFVFHLELNIYHKCAFAWLQMFGSKFEAKNYRYSVHLQERKGMEIFPRKGFRNPTYKGPVRSLDDRKTEVFRSQAGLRVSFEVAEIYRKSKAKPNALIFEIELETEDLKPKDDDVESKASFNGD